MARLIETEPFKVEVWEDKEYMFLKIVQDGVLKVI